MIMNGRREEEEPLDTHTQSSPNHSASCPPTSAKSFVPVISGWGSSVPEGREEGSLLCGLQEKTRARDQGIHPAINYLCNLGRATEPVFPSVPSSIKWDCAYHPATGLKRTDSSRKLTALRKIAKKSAGWERGGRMTAGLHHGDHLKLGVSNGVAGERSRSSA